MLSSYRSVENSPKRPTKFHRVKSSENLLANHIAMHQTHIIKIMQLRQRYYYQMNVDRNPQCPVIIVGKELEILKLMAEGQSNRVISEMLSEPKAIVDGYVICLFNKLKSNNRLQAVNSAFHLGILIR